MGKPAYGHSANSQFEVIAAEYCALWTTRLYDKEIIQKIPRAANLVVEVGCGTGILAARLAAMSKRVIALDISPECVRIAREYHYRKNLRYVVSDMSRISEMIEAETCDAIVAVNSLHNYVLLEELVPRISKSLRTGGKLIALELLSNRNYDSNSWQRQLKYGLYVCSVLTKGCLRGSTITAAKALLKQHSLFGTQEWRNYIGSQPAFSHDILLSAMRRAGLKCRLKRLDFTFALVEGTKVSGGDRLLGSVVSKSI